MNNNTVWHVASSTSRRVAPNGFRMNIYWMLVEVYANVFVWGNVFIHESIMENPPSPKIIETPIFCSRARSLSLSTEQQDIIIMIAQMRNDRGKKSTPLPTHVYANVFLLHMRIMHVASCLCFFFVCQFVSEMRAFIRKGSTCPVWVFHRIWLSNVLPLPFHMNNTSWEAHAHSSVEPTTYASSFISIHIYNVNVRSS